jgi:hypothetical protein
MKIDKPMVRIQLYQFFYQNVSYRLGQVLMDRMIMDEGIQ